MGIIKCANLVIYMIFLFNNAFIDSAFAESKDLPIHEYILWHDFEEKDPFKFWASNGNYLIMEKGLSDVKSSHGKRSFKLDVILDSATYVYWRIPVSIPVVGELSLSGDIYIEKTSGIEVALGTNISIAPAPLSSVYEIERKSSPQNTWITTTEEYLNVFAEKKGVKLLSKNIAGASLKDTGLWIDKIGLFIFAPNGGRIVLYVDNVQLTGMTTEEANYKVLAMQSWQGFLKKMDKKFDLISAKIHELFSKSQAISEDPFIVEAQTRTNSLKKEILHRGYPTPEEFEEINSIADGLRMAVHYEYTEPMAANQPLVTYPWKPTRGKKLLPNSYPVLAASGKALFASACRGEFEPLSFVLRAREVVSNILISISDLVSTDNYKIPESAFDIRLVKCWYQSGDNRITTSKKRILTPELLVKDDSLVHVNYQTKRNFLKVYTKGGLKYIDISAPVMSFPFDAIIEDSDELLPFDLGKNENKQIWITIQIPDNCPSGIYNGKIKIQSDGNPDLEMFVEIRVLPFELEPPFLEYSIYYRGQLPTSPKAGINSEWKSEKQYLIELKDMKDHGIDSPSFYQKMNNRLNIATDLREQVGFLKDNLYVLGMNTGNPTKPYLLSELSEKVNEWISVGEQYGYKNVYIYGVDEAKGDILKSQRQAWEVIQESRAKVFVACYRGAFPLMGEFLDLPILSGPHSRDEVIRWHGKGKRIFSYGNPQVGIEDPLIYRRNYGLGLAKEEYDGAMPYAYQHSFGHIWNDFDHEKYRDHVFAYPVTDDIISTIQWEGFREGVDDVRYLTTLIEMNHLTKEKTLSWLRSITPTEYDPEEVRIKIVEQILSSKRQKPAPPAGFHMKQP